MTDFVHEGLEAFNAGRFEDGGSNLYVNARGEIERIHRTDLDGDGWPDIVVPNTHGHLERGPTRIFKAQGGAGVDAAWTFTDLPNDSGWRSRIADVDGDGFPDLVVCNGENGVTSELPSYVYWGGPTGLTGERTDLPTVGAYDVLAADVSGHGDGRLDLLMPSAWTDHHNAGRPRPIHAFVQVAPRDFEDRGPSSGVTSVAGLAIDGGSLRGDGALDRGDREPLRRVHAGYRFLRLARSRRGRLGAGAGAPAVACSVGGPDRQISTATAVRR